MEIQMGGRGGGLWTWKSWGRGGEPKQFWKSRWKGGSKNHAFRRGVWIFSGITQLTYKGYVWTNTNCWLVLLVSSFLYLHFWNNFSLQRFHTLFAAVYRKVVKGSDFWKNKMKLRMVKSWISLSFFHICLLKSCKQNSAKYSLVKIAKLTTREIQF